MCSLTEYQKYFKNWYQHNFQILRLGGFSKFTQTEDAWKADMEQAYIAGIRKGIKLQKEKDYHGL